MSADLQTNLAVAVGGGAGWHCAIHGTVTRCPFVYMTCDDDDLPTLTQTWANDERHVDPGNTNAAGDTANE